ncbi:hypothetical protein QBC37DRAFT_374263 [Rhypophila decipiens]|uniref:Sm protein B n=1 Tax=Rhypophila decipiens TaxID=261697 RepID=A0AAN6Y776_9PEZI|nr:hypothetical protein QBC37DRAFT_374263 [Rhypophila decipiens]
MPKRWLLTIGKVPHYLTAGSDDPLPQVPISPDYPQSHLERRRRDRDRNYDHESSNCFADKIRSRLKIGYLFKERNIANNAHVTLRTSRPGADFGTACRDQISQAELKGLHQPRAARKAAQLLRSEAVKNRQVRAEASSSHPNQVPVHRLHVGNIRFSITGEDLRAVVSPFGELERVLRGLDRSISLAGFKLCRAEQVCQPESEGRLSDDGAFGTKYPHILAQERIMFALANPPEAVGPVASRATLPEIHHHRRPRPVYHLRAREAPLQGGQPRFSRAFRWRPVWKLTSPDARENDQCAPPDVEDWFHPQVESPEWGYSDYRMRVTLLDGRQMTGQILAFDMYRNLVLADTEEFHVGAAGADLGADMAQEDCTLTIRQPAVEMPASIEVVGAALTYMNLVLADTEEFRKNKRKQTRSGIAR